MMNRGCLRILLYRIAMKRSSLLLCGAALCGAALLLSGTAPARPTAAPAACAEPADGPGAPELPLPAIPDTLRVPAQRAAYLIEHFWDAMDFADPVRAGDRDFVEQHFVNFLSLFPHADPASHAPAVARLLQRAEADADAYRMVGELAEKYLFESGSPMQSEETWILFLERIAVSPVLGPYEVLRPRYQLEMVRKNRPGTLAADFAYITRDGVHTTLHRTAAGERLLLILYDATCPHCQEVMAGLQQDPRLTQAVDAGRVEVLAICLDADREALLASSAGLPETWMTGFEQGDIIEHDRYMLHALPALLLLDGDKRVLLKNVPVEQLVTRLAAEE